DELPAEPDLIRGDGSRSEILDEEQGVVMPLDGKGRRATSEDLDLARCAGLEPEGRALRPRVAEHGAEQELGSAVARIAHVHVLSTRSTGISPPAARSRRTRSA